MAKKITLRAVHREIEKVRTALERLAKRAEPEERKKIRKNLKKLGTLRAHCIKTCVKAYQMWPA